MPRPQHIIIQDLMFSKHRIADAKESKNSASLGLLLEQREVLLEELLWEDQAAIDERLVLCSKETLTNEELTRLAELNKICG